VSDYAEDGRPLPGAHVRDNADVYVFHHNGLVALEVGETSDYKTTVTVGLTAAGARALAQELIDRAEDVESTGTFQR
jgi:hypothetical protein